MNSLPGLIERATTALRRALSAFLRAARTALATQGLAGWPDTFPAVPAHLEPFLYEAYLSGAGGLADLDPQARAWAADAVARMQGSHWAQNVYQHLAGAPPQQWTVLLEDDAHARWLEALTASEMRSAHNAGTLAAAIVRHRETPVLKTWRAHLDDRTRPAHVHANGQTVSVTEPFIVDGERLMFPGDPTSASPGNTFNCRCSIRLTPAPLTASGATMTTPVAEGSRTPDDIWWEGPLAPIGANSADMRRLAATGQLDTRELPLPLLFQPTLSQRHEGAIQGMAVLRRAWIKDGVLHGQGTFDGLDPDAVKVADKVHRGYLGWVSVDLDKALMELDDSNPEQPVEVARSWRLSGATLVGQPAFDTHAKIRIVDKPTRLAGDPDPEEEDADTGEPAPVGGGILTDETVTPDGGEERDLELPEDEHPEGEQHTVVPVADGDGDEEAVDEPPGIDDDLITDDPERKKRQAFKPSAEEVQRASLIASAIPLAPPSAWFEDPRFDKPTGMHVTPQGQVFGHLAEWNRPHMSFPGQYIYAPKSPSAYREFEVGSVLTAEGDYLRVGTLTAGTSHAEHGLTASETMAFYSDTGYGAAIVRTGEDEHGIWVAGSLTPGASAEQIATLRRAPLSGDWRDNGQGLDLVAALAVNRPAFPVLRASVYLEDDKPVSLVAAGVIDEGDAFETLHSDAIPVPPGGEETMRAIGDLTQRLAAALATLNTPLRSEEAAQTAGEAFTASLRERFGKVRAEAAVHAFTTRAMGKAVVPSRKSRRDAAVHAFARLDADEDEDPLPVTQSDIPDRADDEAAEELSEDEAAGVFEDFTDDDLSEAEQFLAGDGTGQFKRKNWVEKAGGLPRYIKRIAKHLKRKGMSESHAIAAAVNTCKRWARGGGNVKPDTVAKAQAAIAEWNAKRLAGRR
ncbi:phage minor head protein [Streptomyces sp. NPDC057302]|uniref:phage minor head protein n=1 Tax=Streptomyces sp. NPDC057302 TaxID=3346094 RepID=UPI00362C88EF